MQCVHRVFQSLFLLDVVSGYVKRHPFPGLSLRVRLARGAIRARCREII
jgi:hypothetical protein